MSRTNRPFTWTCPLTRTGKRSAHSTCAKEFAKEMDFQLVETSDDGNCFFYALTKFGKRSGFAPLLLESNEHKNAMALRELLVNHIQDNIHTYEQFIFNDNALGSINNQIEELRENGAWASDVGDLVPVAGANVFGIHINMYNISDEANRDIIRLIPIRSQQPASVVVSIMRVREGHFQLLWPRSGQFENHNVRNDYSDEKDVIVAAKMAVEAAQVAVSAAKEIARNSRNAHNSPLKNQEKQLNKMIHNLNQLSLGAPRRSTRLSRSTQSVGSVGSVKTSKRRSTRKKSPSQNGSYENNNNELRRVLEESMQVQ
jgi:hypothetical protein